jgi:hypothetical protein
LLEQRTGGGNAPPPVSLSAQREHNTEAALGAGPKLLDHLTSSAACDVAEDSGDEQGVVELVERRMMSGIRSIGLVT